MENAIHQIRQFTAMQSGKCGGNHGIHGGHGRGGQRGIHRKSWTGFPYLDSRHSCNPCLRGAWSLLLRHGLIFVCHWLCQCNGKVCSLLEKDTGRASGTPPDLFVETKHSLVSLLPPLPCIPWFPLFKSVSFCEICGSLLSSAKPPFTDRRRWQGSAGITRAAGILTITVRVRRSPTTLRILSNCRDLGFALLDKKADVDMLEVASL